MINYFIPQRVKLRVYQLSDALGRRISYLRVSVADSCNLRCVYCMPASGVRFTRHGDMMSPQEIGMIVSAAASIGTTAVRLTGGEPLTRSDIVEIAAEVSLVPGVEDVPISTNGIFLKGMAGQLHAAGVTRANVSVDSLNPERFSSITRGGDIHRVLQGMSEAADAGIRPVKMNTVLMKGVNDDELVELTRFALDNSYPLRFIEMMPLTSNVSFQPELFFPAMRAKAQLEKNFRLTPSSSKNGHGPAVYYDVDGYDTPVGFITPLSGNFCDRCNRVRITSTGRLRMCLFGDSTVDLVSVLREGGSIEDVASLIRKSIVFKPERHYLDIGKTSSRTLEAMSQIGG
ncbi:MAG: GTP 3',8-cyclase MoaA [Thermoplasmata archaeon]|nr:GTP 3',8-cyclase MoaA [Candidatus Sysuiplasma acidicola]